MKELKGVILQYKDELNSAIQELIFNSIDPPFTEIDEAICKEIEETLYEDFDDDELFDRLRWDMAGDAADIITGGI